MYEHLIAVQHEFHPVGQGLFSSCSVQVYGRGKFRSVFDCGTISHRSCLSQEVQAFKALVDQSTVGLFCVSHFDADHVNGATELLQALRVEVLALPYLSLAERMLLAVRQKASGEYLRFLADPVSYVGTVSANRHIRVVFIDGGDESSAPPFEGDDRPSRDPQDEEPDVPTLTIPDGEDAAMVDPSVSRSGNSSLTATIVSHHKPFRLGFYWEYMFYNERRTTKNLEALRGDVHKLVRSRQNPNGTYDGEKLIRELTLLYGRSLGRTARAKNRISLVMYSSLLNGGRAKVFARAYLNQTGITPHRYVSVGFAGPVPGVGVLYTGDVFFETPAKLDAATVHFGVSRWDSILLLQVPHHGSSHSWFGGAAAKFHHEISVFTASSGSKQHPSPSVLTDLMARGPYIVHEERGLLLSALVLTYA